MEVVLMIISGVSGIFPVYVHCILGAVETAKALIGNNNKNGTDTNSTAVFNGPGENMYDTCEAGTGGMTLVEKLNAWSKRVMNYDGWEVKDDKSYPTLKDSPTR